MVEYKSELDALFDFKTPEQNVKENRGAVRYHKTDIKVSLAPLISNFGKPFDVELLNISYSGALIATTNRFPIKKKYRVSLEFGQGKKINMCGQIVRQEVALINKYGVNFEQNNEMLDEYLRHYSNQFKLNKSMSKQIERFLAEDIASGDITAAIIPESLKAEAEIKTREAMVLCGKAWLEDIFHCLDADITVEWLVDEGQDISADTTLCIIKGKARAILSGERTALNVLQTFSATATVSRQYAQAVAGTGCKILDTRKTIPGLREAQKYAVKCGGCYNHRMGLFDGILIKENHIMAAGSITKAVRQARQISSVKVEVEVENLDEFRQAVVARPDRIMLDNFSLRDLQTAVDINAGNIELEASGNIGLQNIREIAETGVDFISIGALTKHINAIDLSMRIKLEE